MSKIGKRIQKVRKKEGLTQQELAKKSDVLLTTLTKIEVGNNNNPTIKTLKKIADALEVTVDYLLK